MSNNRSILVVGNLSDGFTFVGPFADHDEASSYDGEHHAMDQTWVATLQHPLAFDTRDRLQKPDDIVCANCGSDGVMVARWADPNTGEAACYDGPDDTRCDACENEGDPGVTTRAEFEKEHLVASDAGQGETDAEA